MSNYILLLNVSKNSWTVRLHYLYRKLSRPIYWCAVQRLWPPVWVQLGSVWQYRSHYGKMNMLCSSYKTSISEIQVALSSCRTLGVGDLCMYTQIHTPADDRMTAFSRHSNIQLLKWLLLRTTEQFVNVCVVYGTGHGNLNLDIFPLSPRPEPSTGQNENQNKYSYQQSYLNQPPTLAPLLSAVRIWLHSVRGHIHMTFLKK